MPLWQVSVHTVQTSSEAHWGSMPGYVMDLLSHGELLLDCLA